MEVESMSPAPALDFSALLKDIPRGAWVALTADRTKVVSYGSDVRQVIEEARRRGSKEPIIMRVPEWLRLAKLEATQ